MTPIDAAAALRTLGFFGIADAILDPSEPLDAVGASETLVSAARTRRRLDRAGDL